MSAKDEQSVRDDQTRNIVRWLRSHAAQWPSDQRAVLYGASDGIVAEFDSEYVPGAPPWSQPRCTQAKATPVRNVLRVLMRDLPRGIARWMRGAIQDIARTVDPTAFILWMFVAILVALLLGADLNGNDR